MSKVVPGARPIPAITEQNQLLALQRIKENLDSLTGQLNALNRVVTHGDLIALDLASLAPGGGGSGLPTRPGNPNFPGGGADDGYDPTKDQTTPPPPAGVEVAAALRTAIVSWDAAPASYRNPSYAEVWVGTSDDRLAASLAGTSTSNFFTFPVTLGVRVWVWVRYVSKANITGPDHDSLGTSTTPGKIGNADLGPLVVQAENLAKDAVDLSGEAVTFEGTIQDPARFGAMAVGYAVTRYLLAVEGVMENLIVADAQIANLSAAKLTAGDGTIGGTLKSAGYDPSNPNPGNGWALFKSGFAHFRNNIQIDGGVYAGGDIIGANVNVTGVVKGGDFTSWAWPVAGKDGFYLGPEGLLVGNFNNGQWVEINRNGTITMPGLSISGGSATFSGNLSGASGTFGTISAGFLWSPTTGNYVNLNSTGSDYFLYSKGGKVRVTADGDSFFTQQLASGVWPGGYALATPITADDGMGGQYVVGYTNDEFTYLIDTGYNVAHSSLIERTLSARAYAVGSFSGGGPPGASGDYVGTLFIKVHPRLGQPFYTPPVNLNNNPYAPGQNVSRVFIELKIRWAHKSGGQYQATGPQIVWTLDTVG